MKRFLGATVSLTLLLVAPLYGQSVKGRWTARADTNADGTVTPDVIVRSDETSSVILFGVVREANAELQLVCYPDHVIVAVLSITVGLFDDKEGFIDLPVQFFPGGSITTIRWEVLDGSYGAFVEGLNGDHPFFHSTAIVVELDLYRKDNEKVTFTVSNPSVAQELVAGCK